MTLQTTQPTPSALEALQGQTVFMAEIGPLAGMSHNCGWAWQQSFDDFPKSIGTKRGANNKLNPTYSKLAALAWLIRHGKIDPIEGINPDAILPPFVASKGKRKKTHSAIAITPALHLIGIHNHKPRPTKTGGQTHRVRTPGVWPMGNES